ncbi:MAG: hypothetical protein K2X77_29310 [Candidatus Obscuribacterales bacterium]|jgi:hypothetical protein|nr:hypothetical protein [Candidatus Obscuribacterales bacterium]
MDGYQTTVLKSVFRTEQTVLWILSVFFIVAMLLLAKEPDALTVLAPFTFFILLLTVFVSRTSGNAHITWGPKGLCYNEGVFNKTIAFNEIGRIVTRVQYANKKKCVFLIIEDKNGRERIKINGALFDNSDIDTFLRCIENNTSARLSLAPMLELREQQSKSAFVVDTDQIKLSEKQR